MVGIEGESPQTIRVAMTVEKLLISGIDSRSNPVPSPFHSEMSCRLLAELVPPCSLGFIS